VGTSPASAVVRIKFYENKNSIQKDSTANRLALPVPKAVGKKTIGKPTGGAPCSGYPRGAGMESESSFAMKTPDIRKGIKPLAFWGDLSYAERRQPPHWSYLPPAKTKSRKRAILGSL
jgi:hypothetical protein